MAGILGSAGASFCPMISSVGLRRLLTVAPALRDDARFDLYPPWMRMQLRSLREPAFEGGGAGAMVIRAQAAGARIVAGTDSPNAVNLHGELLSYVLAGMTPYQALRTATVNAAEALGLDAGSIEPGKLADLVIVEGNPLEDITHAQRVRHVIANGRLHDREGLVTGQSSPSH